MATLTRNLSGKFTKWKEGEIVRVMPIPGYRSIFSIEKLHRKPSGIFKEGLPLFNELAGVPRSALKFHNSPRKNGKLK